MANKKIAVWINGMCVLFCNSRTRTESHQQERSRKLCLANLTQDGSRQFQYLDFDWFKLYLIKQIPNVLAFFLYA